MRLKVRTRSLISTFIQFIGIIIISLVFKRFLEVLIIIPLFFLFRSKYEKTFHANTLNECTKYTLVMFLFICLISLPVNISLLLLVILCYISTETLYYIRDYLDLRQVKSCKITIGMDKNILLNKCSSNGLSDIETKVLIMYYCDRLKRWQIGNVLNYSEDNISKIKKRALDKLV